MQLIVEFLYNIVVKPGSQCQEPVLRLGQGHQEHQDRVISQFSR